MKIKTRCNHCGKVYQMSADYLGKTAQCKQCHNNFLMETYEEFQDASPTLELQLSDPVPPPQPAPPAAGPAQAAFHPRGNGGQAQAAPGFGQQAPAMPAQQPRAMGAAAPMPGLPPRQQPAAMPGFQGQAAASPAFAAQPGVPPQMPPAYGAPMQPQPAAAPYAPPMPDVAINQSMTGGLGHPAAQINVRTQTVVCPKCRYSADIPPITSKMKVRCQQCGNRFVVKPEKQKAGKAPLTGGPKQVPKAAILLLLILLAGGALYFFVGIDTLFDLISSYLG